MIGLRQGPVLGLAIEARRIIAAQANLKAHKWAVTRTAEFIFPDGIGFEDAERLGKALREFLKENGFEARDAVAGIPANWVFSTGKHFPPASHTALAGMVRVEAERRFAAELDQLALDYANGANGSGGMVFITAMPRRKLDQVEAMLAVAGLKCRAVTVTGTALAARVAKGAPSMTMLMLRSGYAESVTAADGRIIDVKHIASGSGAGRADGLRAVLLRLLATAGGADDWGALFVWDETGAHGEAADIGAELGSPVRQVTADQLGIESAAGETGVASAHYVAAVLAFCGARREALPVDFLHSRLARRNKRPVGRKIGWGVAVAGALVLALLMMLSQWRQEERDLQALEGQLSAMSGDIKAARSVVDTVTLARGWTDARPRFLEALLALTQAFPADGAIYVTNLAVRQDMRVLISGKSSDERKVLEALDGIRSSGAVDAVKLLYLREAGGGSREVAFSMTFDFTGRE
mgnify:CR=1 FL=1